MRRCWQLQTGDLVNILLIEEPSVDGSEIHPVEWRTCGEGKITMEQIPSEQGTPPGTKLTRLTKMHRWTKIPARGIPSVEKLLTRRW